MDNQDTLIPYTAIEREKLTAAQNALKRKLLMYSFACALTVYLWLSYPVLLLRVVLGLLSLLYLFALAFLASRYQALGRDLADGQMLVTPGVVEHQELFDTEGVKLDPSRPVFFLRVKGREVGVGADEYKQFKTGDPINLLLGPHSSHVLGVSQPDAGH